MISCFRNVTEVSAISYSGQKSESYSGHTDKKFVPNVGTYVLNYTV
jgi:hypothetical protein